MPSAFYTPFPNSSVLSSKDNPISTKLTKPVLTALINGTANYVIIGYVRSIPIAGTTIPTSMLQGISAGVGSLVGELTQDVVLQQTSHAHPHLSKFVTSLYKPAVTGSTTMLTNTIFIKESDLNMIQFVTGAGSEIITNYLFSSTTSHS